MRWNRPLHALAILLALCVSAAAQTNPGLVDGKRICADSSTCADTASNQTGLNQLFASKQDYLSPAGVISVGTSAVVGAPSNAFLFNNNGTLGAASNIAYVNGGLAVTHGLSGSATLGNLETFTITSDTQGCAFCTDIYSVWNYGGAIARGARANIFAWNIQTAPNSGVGQTTAGIGITAIGQTNTGDGGTGLTNSTAAGTYFGGNLISRVNGLNVYEGVALEADTMTSAGATLRYNFGVTAANFSAVQGSALDAAFAVYSGSTIAAAGGGGPYGPGVGYHCGICFAEIGMDGRVPLDSGATVIGGYLETLSTIPVLNFLDMTKFTPSSNYITSAQFTIDKNGQPTFGSGTGVVVEKINGGTAASNGGGLLQTCHNGSCLGAFGDVAALFGGGTSFTAVSGFSGLTLYTNNAAAISINTSQVVSLPAVTTGTPAASLCIDASNNIVKKTTTGSCI
jgi:hypothetical protein